MKTFVSLLTCVLVIPSAKANLINNGDFESPPVADLATGFETYFSGPTLAGWTVASGSIDVVGDNPGSWVSWKAASGHQSVDLNGYGPGVISQEVPTNPGQNYTLSFALAANVFNSPSLVTLEFLWRDQVVNTVSFQPSFDRADPGWKYLQYQLTAQTDVARLTFGSLVFDGTAGAAIDDICLEPIPLAVPDVSGPWLAMFILLPLTLHACERASQARRLSMGQLGCCRELVDERAT